MTQDDLDAIKARLAYSGLATLTDVAALLAEVERLQDALANPPVSWEILMALLDKHWPASIFPTLADDEERDTGPRIISLLRWVDRLRAEVVRLQAMLDGWLVYRPTPATVKNKKKRGLLDVPAAFDELKIEHLGMTKPASANQCSASR